MTTLDVSVPRRAAAPDQGDAPGARAAGGLRGTGSWLAPDLARLACALKSTERQIDITFVDPDVVEERNVYRQNFCFAETGRPKAIALALRYSAAWGVEIRAVAEPFDPGRVRMEWDALTVLVGCVDNAAARKSIAETLKHNQGVPQTWWLDVGNDRESGQVLLGSAATVAQVRHAFDNRAFCQCLPGPALQEPALLAATPDESMELSCEEMAVADTQSLSINKRMAAEAADYLCRLLGGGRLLKFATYLDLASGSARSRYITPASVAAACNLSPEALFAPPVVKTRKQRKAPRGRHSV